VEQGGMAPDGAGGYLEMAARTDLGGWLGLASPRLGSKSKGGTCRR
jgi:hypothetical protein